MFRLKREIVVILFGNVLYKSKILVKKERTPLEADQLFILILFKVLIKIKTTR